MGGKNTNKTTHSQLLKPAFIFSQAQVVKLVDPDTLQRSSLFFSLNSVKRYYEVEKKGSIDQDFHEI